MDIYFACSRPSQQSDIINPCLDLLWENFNIIGLKSEPILLNREIINLVVGANLQQYTVRLKTD